MRAATPDAPIPFALASSPNSRFQASKPAGELPHRAASAWVPKDRSAADAANAANTNCLHVLIGNSFTRSGTRLPPDLTKLLGRLALRRDFFGHATPRQDFGRQSAVHLMAGTAPTGRQIYHSFLRTRRYGEAMCNLYSITTNQAAILALFRVVNRYVGNLPAMPGVFPDYPAPVIRNAGNEREMVLMRWGMPPPPRTGGPPVTNITSSPHWRGWLKPENRCLMGFNS